MQKRYASIWFPYLSSNWLVVKHPSLKDTDFVFTANERGRLVVKSASLKAMGQGITPGTALADAKAIIPGLEVFEDKAGREEKLLKAIGEWCIRYTPFVAVDLPDGLILDISGCTHLWGTETNYLTEISDRLRKLGYMVCAGIADTIGAAWAITRFGKETPIILPGEQVSALMSLPPAALRLDTLVLQRLHKLGMYQISSFFEMPKTVLRRRFGPGLLLKIAQAIGQEPEKMQPLQVILPYQERLACLEPIKTAVGIEIAIKQLLTALCKRLQNDGMGLRKAVLTSYRVDGKNIHTEIGTNSPSHNTTHLCKLFALKISSIMPGMGIELFVMDAPKTEEVTPEQEALWTGKPKLNEQRLSELLDRVAIKAGSASIHRYLPDAHFWPERSFKPALSIQEKTTLPWHRGRPRPTQLLTTPIRIQVSAPIPDYPPMLFIYKGIRHMVKKADGPERIAQEWWLQEGEHRDYYYVEDEKGQRYWLFRSGHYSEEGSAWFIHGFFA